MRTLVAVFLGGAMALAACVGDSPVTQTDAAADAAEPPLPCDPTEKTDDVRGIFVSQATGNDAGTGVRALPFKTLGAAITAAGAGIRKDIYVAEGIYSEVLALDDKAAGITVHGGWQEDSSSSTWTRDCGIGFRERTILDAPKAVAVTLSFSGPLDPVTFDSMLVRTQGVGVTVADTSGESMFGFLVSGSGELTLRVVKVIAGKAANGGAATPPTAQANKACNGVTDCVAAPLAGTSPPAGSAATTGGTFSPLGFTPSDGQPGADGTAGDNGTPPPPPPTSSCMGPCAGQCQSSDSCVNGISSTTPGNSGKCGCGGLGGKAGPPGRGGGASVAILAATSAKVTLDHVSLVAVGGGDGSAGAKGSAGPGAPGTAGVGNVSCGTGCGRNGPVGGNCGCVITSSTSIAPGGAGGPGSPGGDGSLSGGGAGGPAYGWVSLGGAQVIALDATNVFFSVGGPGTGQGGAPNGLADHTLQL